jgi:putative pyoverdin transport system ATP-binding/permease protein
MRLLAPFLRQSLATILVAAGAAVLAGLASVGLLANINLQLSRPTAAHGPLLLWSFVGLVLLTPVMRVLSSYLAVRLSQRAVNALRRDLTRRILAAPLDRIEELGPHRLQAVIAEDIGNLASALAQLPLLCVSATIVLACLVYLGWLSWPALLTVLVLMVIGTLSYRVTVAAALRRTRLARDEADVLHELYRGALYGTKELKLNALRRQDFLARLDRSGEEVQKLNVSAATLHSAGASWGQSLIFVAIGLLLFAEAALIPGLSRATLTSYAIVILYMLNPLQVLSNVIPDLVRAQASQRKVESLGLLAEGEAEPAAQAPASPPDWSRLDLVGASHHYRGEHDGEPFTLGPIDLVFKAGELVFITGGNGSGKTTLAKLLVGLYRPAGGEIRLDGRAIRDADREAFRQRFAAVFQDFHLFGFLPGDDTPARQAAAAQYLAELQLDRKVTLARGEISTTDLSQGQRKRLALLVAFLEDRPIYVLDEWAADQDPLFKEIFYRQLLPALRARRKTVIAITHDERYYPVADRVIKLSEGKVVDDWRPAVAIVDSRCLTNL